MNGSIVDGMMLSFPRFSRSCLFLFLLGCVGTARVIHMTTFLSSFSKSLSTSSSTSSSSSLPARKQVQVDTMDVNLTVNHATTTNPYFILHVGPPKTATTLLQYTLTQYERSGILDKDKYAYLGQFLDDTSEDMVQKHSHGQLLRQLKETTCIQQTYRARNYNKTWPTCYRRLHRMLTSLRQENQSVILSEEMFSVRYITLDTEQQVVDVWDWKALAQLLQNTGWNPIILVGYRRLHDVLPSAHAQWEKWDKHAQNRVEWPQNGGRSPRPLIPVLQNDPRLGENYQPSPIFNDEIMQWSYTDTLVKEIAPFMPVRVFSIHTDKKDGDSLVSHFFCNVLPNTSAACRYAKANSDMQRRNQTKRTEAKYNRQESIFYDTLVCQAARNGWIDTTQFQRRQVATRAQEYWEHGMGKTSHDLPLECANQQLLDRLLQQSLEKEQKIWGDKAAQLWKTAHQRAFADNVAAYKYCDVNVNATLDEDHWRNFFDEGLRE